MLEKVLILKPVISKTRIKLSVCGFFLIFIVPCPLLDRGSSYSIDHEIDILCRKMFTGKSFETYIQGIRSKFLFQSNNNVVLSM